MESTWSYESILSITESYASVCPSLDSLEDYIQFITELIIRFSDVTFNLVEAHVALPKPIVTQKIEDETYIYLSLPLIAMYINREYQNEVSIIEDVKDFNIFESDALTQSICKDSKNKSPIDIKILRCLLLVIAWKQGYKLNLVKAQR